MSRYEWYFNSFTYPNESIKFPLHFLSLGTFLLVSPSSFYLPLITFPFRVLRSVVGVGVPNLSIGTEWSSVKTYDFKGINLMN